MPDSRPKFTCPFCKKEHGPFVTKCPETREEIPVVYRFNGRVLEGKYEVKRMIAEGGMGVVYEGAHRDIGKKVAIKFLLPEIKASREVLERFRKEALIAASIQHKNIVGVFDMGTTSENIPYMVMDYLEGNSLADMLKLGTVPLRMAVNITMEILSALNAVHAKGVVHRDLKPENVFISEQSGGEQLVKILDFGISHLERPVEGKKLLKTRTGMVIGTPKYMSPEQARGMKDIDHRTDIYSVGVMLYEMLTGRPPFDADNYNKLILTISTQDPAPPSALNPGIPPEIEDIMLRAVAKNPEARFPSAAEFAAFLNAFRPRDPGEDFDQPSVVATLPPEVLEMIRKGSTAPGGKAGIDTPSVEVDPLDSSGEFSPWESSVEVHIQGEAPENSKDRTFSYPGVSIAADGRPSFPAAGGLVPVEDEDTIDTKTGKSRVPFDEEDTFDARRSKTLELEPVPGGQQLTQSSISSAAQLARGRSSWILPLAILIAAAGGLGTVCYLHFTGDKKAAEAGLVPATGPGRSAAAAVLRETVGKKEEKDMHSFTLEGLPPKASVYVDGVLHPERPLIIEDSVKPRRVRIEAPGYRTWDKSVAVRSDISLPVTMELEAKLETGEERDTVEEEKKRKKKKRKQSAAENKVEKKRLDRSFPGMK